MWILDGEKVFFYKAPLKTRIRAVSWSWSFDMQSNRTPMTEAHSSAGCLCLFPSSCPHYCKLPSMVPWEGSQCVYCAHLSLIGFACHRHASVTTCCHPFYSCSQQTWGTISKAVLSPHGEVSEPQPNLLRKAFKWSSWTKQVAGITTISSSPSKQGNGVHKFHLAAMACESHWILAEAKECTTDGPFLFSSLTQ